MLIRKCTIALLFATIVLLVWISCSDDTEPDEESPDDDDSDDQERCYSTELEGYAGGTVTLAYEKCYWLEITSIPSTAKPIYSLNFSDPNDGYAGGEGRVLRFDGAWTDITPSGFVNNLSYSRVIPSSTYLFALGKNEGLGEYRVFYYSFETQVWDNFNPVAQYPDKEVVVNDITVLPGRGVVILARWDDAPHLITFVDNSPVVEDLAPKTEELSTDLVSLATIANGDGYDLWAGGYELTLVGEQENTEATQTAIIMRLSGGEWETMYLPEENKYRNVPRIVMTSANVGYATAVTTYTGMVRFNGSEWVRSDLPQSKGNEFFVADMAFINDDVGWAVGYSPEFDEPLFLLRSKDGWMTGRPPSTCDCDGEKLYAVAMYPAPEADADDDDDNDTTADDDDDDDNDTSDDDDDDDLNE